MKYEEILQTELQGRSYLFGNELTQKLTKNLGIAADNGRKIVERAVKQGLICSTKPLTFGKGKFLYFLPGKDPDSATIKSLAEKNRPPLYRLLQLIDDCDGVISVHEGLKVTSSPEEKTTSNVSLLKDMLYDLGVLKFIVERKSESCENFILSRKDKGDDEETEAYYLQQIRIYQDKTQLDVLFIPDLLNWLKSSNIISSWGRYRSRAHPSTGVKLYHLNWDSYAFTKTTGINPMNASLANEIEKQTMVAMDIVISRQYGMTDLIGFLSRIQIVVNAAKRNSRKVLPIIFYHKIDERTLSVGKKLGFITFSMEKIYGTNVNKLLQNIQSVYASEEEHLTEKIESALKRIADNGQIESLKAIRGVMFEIMMKPIFQHFYSSANFVPAKILKHKDKTREFDYIINSSHPKELILVELKGYAGNSFIRLGDSETPSTLRYFFRSAVPLAMDYYKQDMILEQHTIKAIFITTGGFHYDCNEMIDKMQTSSLIPSKFEKCIVNGHELLKILNAEGFEHEARIINKYYIKIKDEEEI